MSTIPEIEKQYEELACSLLPVAVHFYQSHRQRYLSEDSEKVFFDGVLHLGRFYLEQEPSKNQSLEIFLQYVKLIGQGIGLEEGEASLLPPVRLWSLVKMAEVYETKIADAPIGSACRQELSRKVESDPVLLQLYDLHWACLAKEMIRLVKRTSLD